MRINEAYQNIRFWFCFQAIHIFNHWALEMCVFNEIGISIQETIVYFSNVVCWSAHSFVCYSDFSIGFCTTHRHIASAHPQNPANSTNCNGRPRKMMLEHTNTRTDQNGNERVIFLPCLLDCRVFDALSLYLEFSLVHEPQSMNERSLVIWNKRLKQQQTETNINKWKSLSVRHRNRGREREWENK